MLNICGKTFQFYFFYFFIYFFIYFILFYFIATCVQLSKADTCHIITTIMPILIEHCDGGVIFKYKLDEYYNQNLNPFLQCIVGTELLNRCSLATSTNEAYYNLAFQAKSICTLKQFLLSPYSNGYESDSAMSSSSSSSLYSLEYSDDDISIDDGLGSGDDFIPTGNLFSYNQALMLIGCLTTQLSGLRRNRLSLTQLNLDSIFVIDESVFIMLDPEMITSISPSGMMTFLEPVMLNESSFCCPEIASRTVVPFNCHCNCVYYSFASMLYYCMFNDYLPDKKKHCVLEGVKYVHLLDADSDVIDIKDRSRYDSAYDSGDEDSSIGFEMVNEEEEEDNDNVKDNDKEETCFEAQCAKIEILNGTKMYHFFKRCLDPKGDRRKLFYI